MKSYRIACIPGDGIGKEVIPTGRESARRPSPQRNRACRFERFEDFDWGGDCVASTA